MLQGWEGIILLGEGRMILSQSVLQNLTLYHFLIQFQDGFVINLKVLRASFLWNGGDRGRGFHLVKWNYVCKSRIEGGVGLQPLHSMNSALFI